MESRRGSFHSTGILVFSNAGRLNRSYRCLSYRNACVNNLVVIVTKLVEYDKERKRFYLKVFPNSDIVYEMSFDEIYKLYGDMHEAIFGVNLSEFLG